MRRKILKVIFGLLLLVSFLLNLYLLEDRLRQNGQVAPDNSPTPSTEAILSATDDSSDLVLVTKVIDGDTIVLEGGETVRYIGIDAPEVKGTECFASESTSKNKELVEGNKVRLEKDVSERDRYGRLLRYAYVVSPEEIIGSKEIFVNDGLVREGYAKAATYPPDVKYSEQFRLAEAEARENNRGLWSACQVMSATTASSPTPFQKVPAEGTCKYSCSSPDRDCSDFSTRAEAQMFFDCCGFTSTYDPMRLDKATGQGNGLACESLK
ncbi:thermonuclease family protein [Candidatus Woesebacteria bacterium]|nr:thermonuclease family protein [Candidatus Woesebacteria bacterium]